MHAAADRLSLHSAVSNQFRTTENQLDRMRILCFEDKQVDRLRPAIIARPAYRISCGSYRLMDWVNDLVQQNTGAKVFGHIRPHLRRIENERLGSPQPLQHHGQLVDGEPLLLVNARLAATCSNLQLLNQVAKDDRGGVILDEDGSVIIAMFRPQDLSKIDLASANTPTDLNPMLAAARTLDSPADWHTDEIYHWPHDLVRLHMTGMGDALERRIATGDYEQLQDGVFVGKGVKIGQHTVFDTSAGPVVLGDRVNIGPFCYFAGPVYADADARIIEHSAIKDAVALGHTVKIGGEVEASIIEPYTNKQHHGFLGHSYLGSWINLGAGTCNSDLKNTYGKINAEYAGEKVATGMQFFGCVIGDYSKTAINTSIFTGKIIGVCSMMYGFVTSNVPSYVNYARLFGQTSLLPAEVMISTQARMFARRKVTQQPFDKQLIRDMYTLTADERAADADLL